MLSYLTQGLLLGATAAAQPGPFQAYLLSQVLRNGPRKTVASAFAPLISDGPIIVLTLLVLTRLPGWALDGLRVAGGLFLLYLAWGAFRTFRNAATAEPFPPEASSRGVFKAAAMNLLSPNPWIFWATIGGPILITAWQEAPVNAVAYLVGFYVALIGGLLAFIALFGAAGRLDPRVSRALSGISAVALLLFGLFQLATGSRGLLTMA
jgi:threonine/homoserine/homoserine lactone efflux protein